MTHAKTWVVTFDGASCRVFDYGGVPRRLVEIDGERRDGPHKPAFDDRPGRVYASTGSGRSGVSHHTDPERRMEDEFVAAIAQHLSARVAEKAFDALIVAASPRALGAFREAAPQSLIDKVVREVHGDYANGPPSRLLAVLQRGPA